MRSIFRSEEDEQFFRKNGYIVLDLLGEQAIQHLWSFYSEEFKTKREVYPFAEALPYYISIFDKESDHKKRVDELVSSCVAAKIESLMFDYEVFYSNLMIKFPGNGEIEAHQDFNFVDESQYTAFNLWCPLVDTDVHNGGLFVIPGSHHVFRTQRGPNLPKALTYYNQMMQRYSSFIPLKVGQAIIFDHKLVHYSLPNTTDKVRVAIQSVLKPNEVPALHYWFNETTNRVDAYKIDKQYILESNLWETDTKPHELNHSEELIAFPDEAEIVDKLIELKVQQAGDSLQKPTRAIFKQIELQKCFEENGYVQLPVLEAADVLEIRQMFTETIGEEVKNSDYGMYISLEEADLDFKVSIIEKISASLLPKVSQHFINCKPHLGSFLVKAPGINSYTYPHQDWTFVDPDFCSVTVWIALVDTEQDNGALGLIPGSQKWFDKPIGSPSPDFQTFTQGHEDLLYEYLDIVPLKAGEAIAFDNRIIHGAPRNLTQSSRVAVAIGMTPEEAQLYHYYLLPSEKGGMRRIAKIKVDQKFFHQHSVASIKQLFDRGEIPQHYEIETIIEETFHPYSRQEIQKFCEHFDLKRNGDKLVVSADDPFQKKSGSPSMSLGTRIANGLRHRLAKMRS